MVQWSWEKGLVWHQLVQNQNCTRLLPRNLSFFGSGFRSPSYSLPLSLSLSVLQRQSVSGLRAWVCLCSLTLVCVGGLKAP